MSIPSFMSDLPTSWRAERLDRLFRHRTESARSEDELLSAYIDGVVTLRSNRPEQITKSSGNETGYQHVECGDLVISGMNAHLGGLGIAKESGKCTPVYVVLEPTAEMDPRFIARFLWFSAQSGYVKSLVNAVRYNSSDFRPETVKSMYVPLPPLEEQRRIADFLDDQVTRIDAVITLRSSQRDRVAEAEMDSYLALTGGEGADHQWRVSRAFRSGSGTTPASDRLEYFDGSIAWVASGDLNDGVVERTARNVTAVALTDCSALKIHPKGSLMVAMYGATVGKTGLLGIEACVNQAVCVLTPLGPISSEFAQYWFKAHRRDLIEMASGGGQPNISQDILRGIRIRVGDVGWQTSRVHEMRVLQEWASSVSATVQAAVSGLEEYKRSLITAAVTGELDVTTARRGVAV